jgi:hypothetical protein
VVDVDQTGAPLHRLVRPLLPDLRSLTTGDEVRLAVWTALAVLLLVAGWSVGGRGGRGVGRDQDPAGGEGADADRPVGDLHGHRAVG